MNGLPKPSMSSEARRRAASLSPAASANGSVKLRRSAASNVRATSFGSGTGFSEMPSADD